MLTLLLALTSPADAQDEVLWYEGHDGYSTDTDDLRGWVLGAGASAFLDTDSFPVDLSPYRLIFLVSPRSAPSTTIRAQLYDFVADGGVLVAITENSRSFSDSLAVMNVLVADHGVSSTFTEASLNGGCGFVATSTDAHELVRGLGTLEYGGSSDISVSADGLALLTGEEGQILMALDQGVVLAADANLFNDSCGLGASNQQLVEGLFNGICDDADLDGHLDAACGGDDCDDQDPNAFPSNTETWYDGVDGDCLGDDDFDADADGWASSDFEGEDCDDTDPSVNPEAAEVWYDGVDSDCQGDDDFDADADGWASSDFEGEDCDDQDAAVNPGAQEVWYDGVDGDCDGASDFDADGDGWDADTWGGQDCLDADPSVRPDAPERCDGLDNDCDGEVDGDAEDSLTWYLDADGDGYGDPATAVSACEAPSGAVDNGEDCDDADPELYPNAPGVDGDCAPEYIKICACASGPERGAGWVAVLGLLVLGRRRRA